MDYARYVVSVLESMVDTKRKRHLIGGVLFSASLLFGGLAITVVTIKDKEKNYEKT